MEKYNFKNEWNRTHHKHNEGEIISDDWLERYEEYFCPINDKFLDLGCGSGNDTKILLEKYNKDVISSDFSEVAISLINKKIPAAQTVIFDMTHTFPFDDNSFSFIVSDLSLQYFDYVDTCKTISEIRRVLKKNGYLLLRLSSIEDFNYGAMNGDLLDYHYYFIEKRNKRYFDENDIRYFFSDWTICSIKNMKMESGRYEYPRNVYEVLLMPNDSYNGTKTLYNDTLLLRHLRMNDAEQMFINWASKTEVSKYVIWDSHKSVEDTMEILDKWIGSYNSTKKIWGIEYERNLVGTISVVSEIENSCEVGYVIAPEYWNKGIATYALIEVIEYLKTLGYHSVFAEYFIDNPASGRVMEKVGMHRSQDERMQFNKKTGKEERVIRYELNL